jgi:hypothetical protein
MIDYNSATVPSGSKDRAELLRLADQILTGMDGKAPPKEISPQRDPKARPLYSLDELTESGLETLAKTDYPNRPSHAALETQPMAPWETSEGPQADDSEELDALLDEYGLTPAERDVTALVLDGRPIAVDGAGVSVEFLTTIAEQLNITHANARQRWSRAKRKLTKEAESNGLYRYWVLVQDTRRALSHPRTRVEAGNTACL